MENGPTSNNPRIKHLLNHNPSQPLGVITVLKEDATGLYYESQVGTHSLGQDFIKMVESSLVSEHSIGFQTVKQNKIQGYDEYQKNPSKGMFEITEVKLWEGSSLTAWGANERTPLTGMKSEEKISYLQELMNRQKNLEKFCRNTTATDETIELLLIENKQLTQQIIDLSKSITQPEDSTLPKEDTEILDVLTKFSKSLIK